MNDRNSLIIGLIVLVAVLGMVIYRMQESTPEVHTGGGTPAPDVVTKTLDGQTWRLRDQKGKVVLIDFWATWCGPCVTSIPHMKQVYNRFKSNPDFLMIGVSLDYEASSVRPFIERQQVPWLQLFESSQPFANAFGVHAIPSVWVIGREGQIAGGQLDGQAIEDTVAAELARK